MPMKIQYGMDTFMDDEDEDEEEEKDKIISGLFLAPIELTFGSIHLIKLRI